MALGRGFGRFGQFGASSTAPLGTVDLAAAVDFLPCATDFLGGPGDVARCVWNKIKVVIMSRPDVEALLETVTNSDCSSVLGTLGIPATASEVACALGSSLWERVQNLAANELYAIYRRRGRERTPAEGGGHTLVDGAGRTVAVECPRMLDADGRPSLYEPGMACPTPGSTITAMRPGGAVTKLPFQTTKKPAAKSGGSSTVAVVGGVGALGLLAYLLLA